jgi:hypothetical protein
MRASSSSFTSVCFSAALAIGAGSCSKPTGEPPFAVGSPDAAAAPDSASSPPPEAGAEQAGSDPYLTARPVRAKSIGHTSYVLKLTLEGGAIAAFKPRSRRPLGDHRYKGEIAAYRLATALGLSNVPRAVPRSFAADDLRDLQPDFDAQGLVDDDGRVRGALIPWIPGYRVLPLEGATQRAQWEPWLYDARAGIPEDKRALAASVSIMLAFDYLTANWDRWSGGNVAEDGAGGRVLFVDNDGAFYEWPAPAALARQRALLEHVTRFSRHFIDAVRALDAAGLRAAIGDETPGVPLLSERSLAGVEARRASLLHLVDARVGDAGAAAVLAFD